MRTYRLFQAVNSPDLRGFTDEPTDAKLPAELGPWTLVQEIGPDEKWTPAISRAVVATGIIENGSYLWGPVERPAVSHLIIESDRVEGTAVFDRNNDQIGTIKRLLIEKISGRVLYVDVTFGGFLALARIITLSRGKRSLTTKSLRAIVPTSQRRTSEALRAFTGMTRSGRIAIVSRK